MRMDLYVKELHERIATLEAALREAGMQLELTAMWAQEHFGDQGRYKTTIQSIQADADRARQALTSSEGAGECPHGCVDGLLPPTTPAAFRGNPIGPQRLPCPLHGDHHGEGE